MLKNYQISLEKEEVKELDIIAIKQERSRSYLVRKAIKQLLKEEKKNAEE